MARITIEDCLNKVNNHFELVLVASRRSRQLLQGRNTTLEQENDKPTVIALREVAEGLVNKEVLDEPIIEGAQVEQAVSELMREAGMSPPDLMSGLFTDSAKKAKGDSNTPPENTAAKAKRIVTEEKGQGQTAEEEQDSDRDLDKTQAALAEEEAEIDEEESQSQTVLVADSNKEEQDSDEAPTALAEEKGGLNEGIADQDLMEAAFKGKTDTARLLIASGVDVNACHSDGLTALMMASLEGHTNTVRLLIDAGADVNASDDNGNTALMWAAQEDRTDTVRLLIDAGADVNAGDDNGNTALMRATQKGYTDTANLLKEAGAEERAPD